MGGHREVFRICAGIWLAVLIVGFALTGCACAAQAVKVTNASLTGAGDALFCVSVTDSSNRPIRGLSAANFHASVSDKPANCSVAAADDGSPLTIVLAVDTSLSLAGSPIKSVREGAKAFVDQLGPKDTVCLVAFSRGVRVCADLTSDHQRLKSIIGGLDATGSNTLLYSALVECSRKAARAPSSRCAVVFLTDGKDEGSSVLLQQAISEAQKCGAPFYTIGYGNHANNPVLQRISELTGGRFRTISGPEQTVSLYRDIAQELKNQYIVRMRGPFDPGNRVFSVAVTLAGRTTSDERTLFVPDREPQNNASAVIWFLAICLVSATVLVAVRRARRSNDEYGDEEGRDDMVIDDLSNDTGWATVDTSNLDYTSTSTTNAQVWMEVVKGPHRGARFVLTGKPVRIGRGTDSELSLQNDAAVSRLHAEIRFGSTGEFVLRDMGSENGTRIQSNELNDRSVRLRDGDRISLGATELVYRDERLRYKSR